MEKKKIVTVHQPNFLPWIGLIHKVFKSDVFIYLADVKYSSSNFQNKTYILGADGKESRLTVPLQKKPEMLHEKLISYHSPNQKWKRNHLKQISEVYKKTRHFQDFFPLLEEAYQKEHALLVDLNIHLFELILKYLNYEGETHLSNDFNTSFGKTKRLVSLVKQTGGTCYLSGRSGKDYLEEELFHKEGIEVVYQKFIHPVYYVKNEKECVKNLSILDWIMHYPADQIKETLTKDKLVKSEQCK
ncbi:WbqC family protein [Peribacillus sp. NPDC058075]|uniref:WbqC family protein n=1 Tax=unclassified Peribacillus TaxID=2675266 RepID=UPI0036D82ED5